MGTVERLPPVQSFVERPICVDLDGTLVNTDTLLESLLLMVKNNPLYLFLLPVWLLKGKAHFKQQVGSLVEFDAASLPYNSELLTYLAEEHRKGRRIVLTTAADSSIANRVAKHLGLFSDVLSSDQTQNCAGRAKLEKIQTYLGSSDFLYVGNGRVDLPIWSSCKNAIIVNARSRLVQTVRKVANVTPIVKEKKSQLGTLARAIRAHQWVKNGLIFVPLLASHQLTDGNGFISSLLAFAAFSLCSSSTYVLNDLLDLEADRRHPRKKQRPFACGDLSIGIGLIIVPALLLSSFAISSLLPLGFRLTLGAYFVLTVLYSLYLKRIAIIDVILLALLYTIRVIAGGMAADIQISNWLFVFSMFLFLSLALLKRYSELHVVASQGREADKSRGYFTDDVKQLASMGSASGYMTALVLALYINSEDVRPLYAHPQFLWLICPLILYWISRAWLIAGRGTMHDDPVIFAINDKTSYAVGILAAAIFGFAIG
jgi:4-hydroxybenzoate polyprenyltransferase/phosphoserine phosphatase